jgi:hypothetical protein
MGGGESGGEYQLPVLRDAQPVLAAFVDDDELGSILKKLAARHPERRTAIGLLGVPPWGTRWIEGHVRSEWLLAFQGGSRQN